MYFIITLLILTSFVAVVFNYKFDFFVKEKTFLLKAFLPYMIFIHHSHFFDCDFYYAGAFVVSLFFFMSGYGLETKRIMGGVKSINRISFVNSLRKLIVPIFLPLIVYLTIRLTNNPFDVIYEEDIRKYQLILPYTWFVVTLIILYFLFYSCVTITNKLKRKDMFYLCLIIIAILSFNIFGKYIGIPSWARNTTTAFLAGIIYKRNEDRIIPMLNKHIKMMVLFLSLLLIFVTVYVKGDFIEHSKGPLIRPFLAFVWSFLFIMLYSLIPIIKNKVIIFLSSISYELYICQSIAFVLLGNKHQYTPMIYILLSFTLCTIVAYCCSYLTRRLFYGNIK